MDHYTMPAAARLFHKASIESAAPLRLATRDGATARTERTLQLLGLSTADIPALHDMPAARLLEIQQSEAANGEAPWAAPGDVRVEERPDPRIEQPTDAVIRLSAACVCGSDLWPYRGVQKLEGATTMGHEYVGIVEAVGRDVRTVKPGQFVVGSFWASDNTCEICRAGYQSGCVHRVIMGSIGTQAEYARIPLADGTLVGTPEVPPAELIPSYLAATGPHRGGRWLVQPVRRPLAGVLRTQPQPAPQPGVLRLQGLVLLDQTSVVSFKLTDPCRKLVQTGRQSDHNSSEVVIRRTLTTSARNHTKIIPQWTAARSAAPDRRTQAT